MEKRINYTPGTQSFSDGSLGPKGDVGYNMVCDLDKIQCILDQIDGDILNATIGLDGDFGENSQSIFDNNGNIIEELYIHNQSIWAEPILVVTFHDKPSETYSCWKKEDY